MISVLHLDIVFEVSGLTNSYMARAARGGADVDWTYCKHPLPEHVYDVYVRYWGDVWFEEL